ARVARPIHWARGSEVRGPVAIKVISPSRGSAHSEPSHWIKGWFFKVCVIEAEKASRSTVRASPPGTRLESAVVRIKDPILLISALRMPGADRGAVDLREFVQTSSAAPPVWWAGVNFW